MPADPAFDALLTRFEALGYRDRRAVLGCMAADERARVEARIAAHRGDRAKEAERQRRAGRQFAGYSPWLSRNVQQACADPDASDGSMKAETRRALAEAHGSMQHDESDAPKGVLDRLRAWIDDMSGTSGGRRS